MPEVNGPKEYGDRWNAWWWSMQPSWRDLESPFDMPSEASAGSWSLMPGTMQYALSFHIAMLHFLIICSIMWPNTLHIIFMAENSVCMGSHYFLMPTL